MAFRALFEFLVLPKENDYELSIVRSQWFAGI